MSGIVYQNALAPEACIMQITNASAASQQFDLSSVTAAAFSVMLPDRTLVTWPATTTYANGVLTVSHPYQAGDTAQLGPYIAIARLTLPGGSINSRRDSFAVVDPFHS